LFERLRADFVESLRQRSRMAADEIDGADLVPLPQ